jgi:hypothetical protein
MYLPLNCLSNNSKNTILKWLISSNSDKNKQNRQVATKTSVLVDQEVEKFKGSHWVISRKPQDTQISEAVDHSFDNCMASSSKIFYACYRT